MVRAVGRAGQLGGVTGAQVTKALQSILRTRAVTPREMEMSQGFDRRMTFTDCWVVFRLSGSKSRSLETNLEVISVKPK